MKLAALSPRLYPTFSLTDNLCDKLFIEI
jgi:hypothetical protein